MRVLFAGILLAIVILGFWRLSPYHVVVTVAVLGVALELLRFHHYHR